jgi:hypothetical protein
MCGEEHSFRQRGLALAAMPHEGDISDVLGLKLSHNRFPPCFLFSSLPFSIRSGWDACFAYQSGQIIHEYSKKEKKKFEKQQHDDESVLFFIQIAEFSYQSP